MGKKDLSEWMVRIERRRTDPRFQDKALETQCVHAGERLKKPDFWSASTPIHSSVTFRSDKMNVRPGTFKRQRIPFEYARSSHPTEAVVGMALATLEGAELALATATGMAAMHLAIVSMREKMEDKVLFCEDVYGSVYDLLDITLPELGAQAVHEDFSDLNRLEDTLKRERPHVVCFEVETNPQIKVLDAPAIIELAHRYGAKVLVDNTWTTPYLLQPFSLGADVVVHSVSKFLAGHGDVLGGVVMCRAEEAERFMVNRVRFGPTIGAFEAWLILRGLKTFALRFPRQCENAFAVARYLEQHPLVAKVVYPGLPNHPQHELAKRIFAQGAYGAMVRFEVADCDYPQAFRFLEAMQVVQRATTLGDIFSEINYIPFSPRYEDYSEEAREAMDIRPGMMRLSVGIESAEDIMADLDQALRACQ